FDETLSLRDEVAARYPITLKNTQPRDAVVDQWRTDTDACCNSRKVVPLALALAGRAAWITGVRRADSPVRADTPIVQRDKQGRIKVNPLATWSDDDMALYAQLHEVPRHRLLDQGYPSIGCWPCTRQVAPGEDARSGRWSGSAKTECGLHV
ncbi:MAG TPA: phosphoadenylyl-sulfate reductase, partial [Acidimicrobiales bacterium]